MHVSLNWLCELVPGLSRDANIVADALTSVGLEVESVKSFGAGLGPLCFASVVGVVPHPKREKLNLVTVSLGKGGEQTVVCGARNVPAAGGQVVLAPLGAHLPAVGLTLVARDIGGVSSEGMLCSEKELGLAEDGDGILTFAAGSFEPGTPFLSRFPQAEDTIFELGITPNRPDALGHRGVARDLAARFSLPFAELSAAKLPQAKADGSGLSATAAALPTAADGSIEVENRAPLLCRRYGARVVTGVKVRRSPEWLRWRLFSLGVRPISNVVDITNLLLLEYGNPMHAFDLARVAGRRLVIRNAAAGETLTTLDGKPQELLPSDLVIADGERPTALAGIMGGAKSEIRGDTTQVVLECAYFEPSAVRRTARRLALHTDSSYRFERGVDFRGLEMVLSRAAELLAELADGRALPSQFVEGQPLTLPSIPLRQQRLNALLGIEVDFARALNILTRLGFELLSSDASSALFKGASFRPDVSLEADLIEEVARIVGLDQVPAVLPAIRAQEPSSAGSLLRRCRHAAAGLGLNEAVPYSFVASSALELLGAPKPVVRLKHPLSEERAVMTTSLLPGLLDAVQRAQRHGESEATLFTVGSLFLAPNAALPDVAVNSARPRASEDLGQLPDERLAFAAVLFGKRPNYLQKGEFFDVYDAKGIAVELVERLTGQVPAVASSLAFTHLHPRAAAVLTLSGREVGRFGQLHPTVTDALELDSSVHVIELDLDVLEEVGSAKPHFRPIPRLPAVTRDVALDAPESMRVADLQAVIEKSAGEICESVQLFDVFRQRTPEGERRSVAFRLVYRDPKAALAPDVARTLTDKEVDAQQAKVVAALTAFGAVQRA